MLLPYAQDELIDGLLTVNPNTIIAMVAGSPVEMPWRDKAKAIVNFIGLVFLMGLMILITIKDVFKFII